MKHLTTLAAVSMLAVAGWAASAPGAPARTLGFQAAAACPTPAAAVPAAQKTWKHGQPEYADMLAVTKATGAAQAQDAAAFVQKYPDSDYKNQALQIEMAAQAANPSLQSQAVETAETLLKSPGADASQMLVADAIIAFTDPTQVQPTDPNLAAKMAVLMQAATCGQQLLPSAPAAQKGLYGPMLTKGLGFAQLNTKDYTGAIATLTKASQEKATDPLPYYWMGIAEVTQPTPDYNAGIFDLAKASVLAPQVAAFKTYLNTVYTSYHGSADGLQDVITAATNNATPPAGFSVLSKVDVENAQNMAEYQKELEIQKNTLPPEDSFPGIEARLKRPDLAADEWTKVKGQGIGLQGLVVSSTATTVNIAVGTDPTAPADIHLVLAAPLVKRPKVGTNVTIQGIPVSYKPNPPDANAQFLLTLNQGSITDPKGYSPTAPAAPAQ